ncbi:hypothetical protein HDU76_003779 [Blyttiomyces sp. JEL0837]|nr:hypothetical protein HDU76_003779 [Blyttiomyces sp. JEL0837]
MRTSFLSLLVFVSCLIGFALSAPTDSQLINKRAASPTQYPYGTSDISVINTYHNEQFIGGEGGFYITNDTFQVDFAVKNKAFVKEVGIRFTNDSWSNFYEAQGQYTGKLDNNGYEIWTLNFWLGMRYSTDPKPEYEIAAYVSYNKGLRSWDPKNNYFIYQKATPQNPVVHLKDNVFIDSNTKQVVLTGSARVYPFDFAKDFASGAVQIHWTTDNWQTIHDSSATSVKSNQTWSWKVNVANSSKALPPNVTYAIHYISSAGSFWDNNYQNNYYRILSPQCNIINIATPPAIVSSGIYNVDANCYSDLPIIQPSQFRLDNNPFMNITTTYLLNASSLANGLHTAEVRAFAVGSDVVAGGFVQEFVVKNTVTYLGEWIPDHDESVYQNAWSVEKDSARRIYFGDDLGRVKRYPSFGVSGQPDLIFSNPYLTSDVNFVSVDNSTGDVYAMSYTLYKYFANGTWDVSFGNGAGNVTFGDTVFGSSKFCNPGSMRFTNGFIFIGDSCNGRIVKLSSNGTFLSEVLIPAAYDNAGIVGYLGTSSTTNNLLASVEAYQHPTLILEIDPVTLTTIKNYTLSRTDYYIDGIVTTPTQLFFTSQYENSVVVVDIKTGKTVGQWNGSGGYDYPAPSTPGHFDVIRDLVLLDGDRVAALSVTGGSLQVFSQKLLA